MPKGGDRGGRKPRSPTTTLTKIATLEASISARPEQLTKWTESELQAVVRALRSAGAAFQNELDDRWHRRGLEDND